MGLLDQLQAYIQANTPRNTRPEVSPAKVIDQGLLGGRIGQIPQRAEEMKQGLLRAPQDLTNLNSPAMRSQVDAAMAGKGKPFDREAGMQLAMDALQVTNPVGGLLAHTVYHGSPHKFNAFDMSKIGTGEGAQAYGHGLYMAESPAVAKSYADVLGDSKLLVNGKPFDAAGNTTQATAVRAIAAQGYDKSVKAAKQMLDEGADPNWVKNYIYDLNKLKGQDIRYESTGNLYKVDIPDEAIPRMLDWDKPLSEQAPEVQAALEQTKNKQLRTMLDYAKVPYTEMAGGEAKTMGEAFRLLNLNLHGKSSADSAKASALLAKEGIPGIRYLDGSSRTAGAGSSNFVLFDDAMPRILEINGKPTGLLPWADDAAQNTKKAGLLDSGGGSAKIGGMKNSEQAWAKTDVFGNGSKIEHISPDGKSAVVQQMTQPGKFKYYPANVHEQFGVQPDLYKGFDTLEEARKKIKGMRISDTLKQNNNTKYGSIPNTWAGDAKKLAKSLIDNDVQISKFSSSSQSKSKYIELVDGRKIRLSDHNLPLSYEGSDFDFRYGSDINALLDKLGEK